MYSLECVHGFLCCCPLCVLRSDLFYNMDTIMYEPKKNSHPPPFYF